MLSLTNDDEYVYNFMGFSQPIPSAPIGPSVTLSPFLYFIHRSKCLHLGLWFSSCIFMFALNGHFSCPSNTPSMSVIYMYKVYIHHNGYKMVVKPSKSLLGLQFCIGKYLSLSV